MSRRKFVVHGTPDLFGRPSGALGDLFGSEAAPGKAPERGSLGLRRKPLELQLGGSMHRTSYAMYRSIGLGGEI
jgi:hypothetical protein